MRRRLARLMFHHPQVDDPNNPGGTGGTGGAPQFIPPTPPPTPTPTPNNVVPGRTFTQQEVADISAREKDQGRRSAAKELAEQYGFQTPEELKAFVEAQKAAQQASLTEQQRKEQELAQREAAAAAKEQAAAQVALDARKTTALATAGVAGTNLGDARLLLQVADDADDATLTTAIEALRTRRPELFAAAVTPPPGQRQPLPSGAPAGTPPGSAANQQTTPGSRGTAEAERRFKKAVTAAS